MKVFIGGSKNINKLSDRVIERLDTVIAENEEVLIGDCYGVDALVQEYLSIHNYKNVRIYVSGDKVRNNIGDWPMVNIQVSDGTTGFEFYRQKDMAMAKDADYGIMIWDGDSKGTYSNIKDLQGYKKKIEIIMEDDKYIPDEAFCLKFSMDEGVDKSSAIGMRRYIFKRV